MTLILGPYICIKHNGPIKIHSAVKWQDWLNIKYLKCDETNLVLPVWEEPEFRRDAHYHRGWCLLRLIHHTTPHPHTARSRVIPGFSHVRCGVRCLNSFPGLWSLTHIYTDAILSVINYRPQRCLYALYVVYSNSEHRYVERDVSTRLYHS